MADATTTDIKQVEERLLTIETPFGPDEFIVTEFEGVEELSRPFSYQVDVISRREKIDPAEILGKSVTLVVRVAQDDPRPFNGIVKRLSLGDRWGRGYRRYSLEVVPAFWLLTRRIDIRIFQQKTAHDIIKSVLQGIDFDWKVEGSTRSRDYCVQYRESDFDFVSRLMEEEGIHYYFRHQRGAHKMIIANTPAGAYPCEDAEVAFRRKDQVIRHVSEWIPRYETRSGKWTLQDFNYEAPASDLSKSVNTRINVPAFKQLEVYDYPGLYVTNGPAETSQKRSAEVFQDNVRVTTLRMQEHEAEYQVIDSACECVFFSPGATFNLTAHESPGEAGKYLITAVQHSATDHSHVAGEGVPPAYTNRFSCIPATVPFRPASITPKPFVHGPQTATVVGPSGEEIFTDKYARVKVQFHWDRLGKKDENSSCWVRVAQSWAGRQWGTIFIPRIGMEVVVDFLEGDPDQPLIIGVVYNAENMPPYSLPDNKTQSGIKTRSSQKGGAADFNELRFEDKKGAEEIYFHAQKNFTRIVENDDSLEVLNKQTITITQDRTETITKGNEKVTLEMGNRTHQLDMGNDKLTLKMGNRTTKLDLGKDYTEAMQSIELKVGASSIKIDQMGVTIKGMMIKIDGSIMTDVKAGAMLTLKGPLTLIN